MPLLGKKRQSTRSKQCMAHRGGFPSLANWGKNSFSLILDDLLMYSSNCSIQVICLSTAKYLHSLQPAGFSGGEKISFGFTQEDRIILVSEEGKLAFYTVKDKVFTELPSNLKINKPKLVSLLETQLVSITTQNTLEIAVLADKLDSPSKIPLEIKRPVALHQHQDNIFILSAEGTLSRIDATNNLSSTNLKLQNKLYDSYFHEDKLYILTSKWEILGFNLFTSESIQIPQIEEKPTQNTNQTYVSAKISYFNNKILVSFLDGQLYAIDSEAELVTDFQSTSPVTALTGSKDYLAVFCSNNSFTVLDADLSLVHSMDTIDSFPSAFDSAEHVVIALKNGKMLRKKADFEETFIQKREIEDINLLKIIDSERLVAVNNCTISLYNFQSDTVEGKISGSSKVTDVALGSRTGLAWFVNEEGQIGLVDLNSNKTKIISYSTPQTRLFSREYGVICVSQDENKMRIFFLNQEVQFELFETDFRFDLCELSFEGNMLFAVKNKSLVFFDLSQFLAILSFKQVDEFSEIDCIRNELKKATFRQFTVSEISEDIPVGLSVAVEGEICFLMLATKGGYLKLFYLERGVLHMKYSIKAHNQAILASKLLDSTRAVSLSRDHSMKEWSFSDCVEMNICFEDFKHKETKPFLLMNDLYNSLFLQQKYEEGKKALESLEKGEGKDNLFSETGIFTLESLNFSAFLKKYFSQSKAIGDKNLFCRVFLVNISRIIEGDCNELNSVLADNICLETQILNAVLEDKINLKDVPEGQFKGLLTSIYLLNKRENAKGLEELLKTGNILEAWLIARALSLLDDTLIKQILNKMTMFLSRKQITQAIKVKKIQNLLLQN